ncbi:Superfamily II DNA or RNA helicase [Geodermatophilus amargosae]|uniref:Superfamily II DNA or RNA helicase n=1 Tax=Geodermatophilus amargosae TaxID=1296565 RepID=A0A1I7CJ03_9ACTN|nr:helicase [Geodermatophilus amargosae]SFT99372.1 Superfamily II DNA or RNA helicase [Geodermatophilus amargosae]
MPGRRRAASTTPKRRTATRRRSPARKPAVPDLPTAGPGERVWVLAVPFRAPAPGAVWHAGLQAHVWVGAELPPALAPYDPPPYTLERFLEDELNETPRPLPEALPMVPREEQCTGAEAVVASAAAGHRVFLLGDDPGVGKTGTAVMAAREICQLRGGERVLVVADRPAAITIPHWTRSIAGFGDGGLRWCVTTWDRLAKVAELRFDVVIADEAHMVRHTTTQRWKHWKAVSGGARAKDVPFVVAATATPAHTPLELPYLAPQFAQRHDEPLRAWADLPARLAEHGFHVERGRYGWSWTEDPDQRRTDLARLQGWLAGGDPPATLHRSAPWGPVSVTGTPVALTPAEQSAYASEWQEFRAEMQLARKARQSARGRAALLRFRQKAGLIRAQATVDWARAQVEAERQVAVSVEFVETAADPIREALLDSGVAVASIYGRDRFDVEAERLRFQTGAAPVCVFTVTASISLHAGELLPGGTTASTTPRVGLFHQPRFSGIQARQVTGRTHRDGQVSPWRVAFAEGTVEEQVARVMVERLAVSGSTAGADTSSLQEIAELLDADWLPPAALSDTG